MQIRVLTLGGTISSERSDGGTGSVPRRTGGELVAGLPVPEGVVIAAEAFRLVPSPALTSTDRRELAAKIIHLADSGHADAVVVSQGTDSLEETAFALDLYGAADRIPVVVTGAMRDASSVSQDGPLNLADAIAVAASGETADCGVVVVFDGLVHAARWVAKRSTFRSVGFGSDPLGPIGVVTEGRPRVWLRPVAAPRLRLSDASSETRATRVAVIAASPGEPLDFVSGVVGNGYGGLVVLGLGAGHVAEVALPGIRALASTMPVVVSTRVASGPGLRESYGYAGAEVSLREAGCVIAGALSGPRAAVLLEAALAEGADAARIRHIFAQFD